MIYYIKGPKNVSKFTTPEKYSLPIKLDVHRVHNTYCQMSELLLAAGIKQLVMSCTIFITSIICFISRDTLF